MDDRAAAAELLAELDELSRRLDDARPSSGRVRPIVAAAVGAALAATGSSRRAFAAGALTTDSVSNVAASFTQLDLTASNVARGLAVTDGTRNFFPATATGTAVLGFASGNAFVTGVAGHAASAGAIGVVGSSRQAPSGGTSVGVAGSASGANAIGVKASGAGACTGVQASAPSGFGLRLTSGGAALLFQANLLSRRDLAIRNEIVGDVDGTLRYLADAGSDHQTLSGPATAGAFHAIDPVRVYDSRLAAPSPGVLGGGRTRVVSVADGRDAATGTVSRANAVPDGATAIAFNLTITATTGAGYLAIAPGNVTESPSSSINWSAAGQTLANGLIAKIHTDRSVAVFSGGGGTTHFIIDINGYWR